MKPDAGKFSFRNHFPSVVIKDQHMEWTEQHGSMQVKGLSFSKNLDKAKFAVVNDGQK